MFMNEGFLCLFLILGLLGTISVSIYAAVGVIKWILRAAGVLEPVIAEPPPPKKMRLELRQGGDSAISALLQYIYDAKRGGCPDEEISTDLAKKGWTLEQVAAAWKRYTEILAKYPRPEKDLAPEYRADVQ